MICMNQIYDASICCYLQKTRKCQVTARKVKCRACQSIDEETNISEENENEEQNNLLITDILFLFQVHKIKHFLIDSIHIYLPQK